ncbi:MAG: hypothetical protein FWE21_06795 [Defluviitaleaceae bacterium]|nr:hypothetical protein [Defluviitaleaceae bacterium]
MTLFYGVLSATLVTTPIILLILAATPFMRRLYAPNGRFVVWLVISAALMLPFIGFLPSPTVEIAVPLERLSGQTIYFVQADPRFGLLDAMFWAWIGGVLASVVIHAAQHIAILRFLNRWGYTENNPAILTALDKQKIELKIRTKIRVLRCKGIASPMLTGLVRPIIILPSKMDYSDAELAFVLKHELIHHKRRDIWAKLLLLAVKCVYWFNPAVYLMARQADKDAEMICDSLTTHGMETGDKKRYSQLILSLVGVVPAHLSTSMASTGKKMLKQRIAAILEGAKKRGRLLFSALCLGAASVVTLVGFTFAAPLLEAAQSPLSLSHFMPPRGYSWQNVPNLRDENIVRVSFDENNLSQLKIELDVPIYAIDVDFPATIYITHSDSDFVHFVVDEALMDFVDGYVENGVLTIPPLRVNVVANKNLRDFTRIYVGVSGDVADVGIGILHRQSGVQGDVNIHTHCQNPVNITVNAPSTNLHVAGVADISFFGESDSLVLYSHATNNSVDMSGLPVSDAVLNLAGRNTSVLVDAESTLEINLNSQISTFPPGTNTVLYFGNPTIYQEVVSGDLILKNAGGRE